ncbi:hypothetical protein B0T26DRAFT_873784 [Lasiosphaeria miniovina]|uniref:Uncharacterized protein n=1 Tax=Lasiosphaeria miniovina TaxID=1954250 RepID=A0AA40AD74_9PEZI|nr:uncharacterized protein B0T26DRAFT_873784 [Lasiosphaeria miniovina]KAK0713712.1 hypothetical protein B0T26DRAFT_873784 [Lasiosphaeria miniovina]
MARPEHGFVVARVLCSIMGETFGPHNMRLVTLYNFEKDLAKAQSEGLLKLAKVRNPLADMSARLLVKLDDDFIKQQKTTRTTSKTGSLSSPAPPPLNTKQERFSVHIKSHGTFLYRYPDEDDSFKWVNQTFEFASSKNPFECVHDTEKDTYSPKSALFQSEQLALQISGGAGDLHEPLPLQCPLGV